MIIDVSDHLLDRLPTGMSDAKVMEVVAKEEGMEMILNAFARQTLWKEVLNVIDELKEMNQVSSPGKPLPQAYQRKIGLLAKLVEVSRFLSSRLVY